MKHQNQKVLLYDNTCPMCTAYTNAFVKLGFLERNGRIPFTELRDEMFISKLDLQRAKHEIPMIDFTTGETLYGIDALIKVLSVRIPFIKHLNRTGLIYRMLKKMYAVISYNRRIIIPAEQKQCAVDCTPDFNLKYRFVFITFSIIVSILITWLFGATFCSYINSESGGMRMLLIAGTGWMLQIATGFIFLRKQAINYSGHLAVIMIIGVLLLVPGIIMASFISPNVLIPLCSVILSSIIMLRQHIKRVRHLKLSQWYTVSWFFALQLTAAFWFSFFYYKNF